MSNTKQKPTASKKVEVTEEDMAVLEKTFAAARTANAENEQTLLYLIGLKAKVVTILNEYREQQNKE